MGNAIHLVDRPEIMRETNFFDSSVNSLVIVRLAETLCASQNAMPGWFQRFFASFYVLVGVCRVAALHYSFQSVRSYVFLSAMPLPQT